MWRTGSCNVAHKAGLSGTQGRFMVVDVSTFWDSVAERFSPSHIQGATREWTLSHFLPSISWRTQIDCLRQHSYGQRPTPSRAQGLRKRRTGRLPLGSTYLPGFMGIFQSKNKQTENTKSESGTQGLKAWHTHFSDYGLPPLAPLLLSPKEIHGPGVLCRRCCD